MSDPTQASARLHLFESAVECLTDIIVITDAGLIDEPGPRIVFANKAFEQAMGYGRDEVIGLTPRILHGPRTERLELDRIRLCLEARQPIRTELINYTKSGEERWMEMDISPISDASGECTHFLSVGRDITDRKRADDEASEMKQRLETLVAKANIGILVHRRFQPMMANSELARIFGYAEPADILALPDCRVLLEDFDARSDLHDDAPLPHTDVASTVYSTTGTRTDGSLIDLEIRTFTIPWGQERAACSMVTDVSVQRDVEARLRQAQRLDAIGQLTGGVAHDFNNLLTVILGNIDALVGKLDDDELLPLAEMVQTAAERAAELTSRLLSFARRQPLDPRTVDVHQLLADMQGMLRRTLGEQIRVALLAAEPWQVLVDPHQLENAVLNLCINARDAMPDGGDLTIQTINVHLDEAVDKLPDDVAPGDYVCIAVRDTGVGMSKNSVARAFEPFFTTKETGRGTGLGLSTVYGFVKQSRGHVTIASLPGGGTTVRMFLPRAVEPLEPPPGRSRDPVSRGRAETILLVEDDDLVRDLAADMLMSLGYVVISASDGTGALATLKGGPGIDMMFTDIVMPGGMTGYDLATEAHRLLPELPILFSSGYSRSVPHDEESPDRDVRLLAKPYRLHELATVVREILDG